MRRFSKTMSRGPLAGVAVVVLAAAGALGMFSWTGGAAVAGADAAGDQLTSTRDLSESFQAIAKSVGVSVVNISTVKRVTSGGAGGPFMDPWFENHPFREFFEDFFDRPGRQRPFEQRGLGSGVIVNQDGYILTNHHVIRDADEVTVTVLSGESYTAEVVGTDPHTDLAVLRVEADGLQPAEFGDSDALEVGEWVVAIGNPFGLDQTVTAGIVSAKGRANMGLADYEDFIQTDAAINPGNSGGPLVNLDGQIVGINTAIVSRSGGYQGVGFAIPVNMAKSVMADLIEKGVVQRGWLGVLIQDLTEELARSFGHDGSEGVLISDVTADSPASRAGLQAGDIIVGFDGRPVENVTELRNQVASVAPGSEVEIEIFREGERRTLTVTLGELDIEMAAARPGGASELGASVQDVPPDVARRLGLERARGVVVTDVEAGSVAARAGLEPRDVILSVNGEEVNDVETFNATIAKHDLSEGIRMLVRSGDVTRFVFVKSRD